MTTKKPSQEHIIDAALFFLLLLCFTWKSGVSSSRSVDFVPPLLMDNFTVIAGGTNPSDGAGRRGIVIEDVNSLCYIPQYDGLYFSERGTSAFRVVYAGNSTVKTLLIFTAQALKARLNPDTTPSEVSSLLSLEETSPQFAVKLAVNSSEQNKLFLCLTLIQFQSIFVYDLEDENIHYLAGGSRSSGVYTDGVGTEASFFIIQDAQYDAVPTHPWYASLLVCDSAGAVRSVNNDGLVKTIAGSMSSSENNYEDGDALNARFKQLRCLCIVPDLGVLLGDANVIRLLNSSSLYVSTIALIGVLRMVWDGDKHVFMAGKYNIRRLSLLDFSVVTVAGTTDVTKGVPEDKLALGVSSVINANHIVYDITRERLLLFDSNLFRALVSIDPTNSSGRKEVFKILTVAGRREEDIVSGRGEKAMFSGARSLCLNVTDEGQAVSVFVGSDGGNVIQRCDLKTYEVETVVGVPFSTSTLCEGPLASVRLPGVENVAVHPVTGDLYFICSFSIAFLNFTTNYVRVLAGTHHVSAYTDGLINESRFERPTAILFDNRREGKEEVIFVLDQPSNAIRNISGNWVSTLVGGNRVASFVDGPFSTAKLNRPRAMTWFNNTSIVFGEKVEPRIRLCHLNTRSVSTLAGNGISDDMDGLLLQASFTSVRSLATHFATSVVYVSTGLTTSARIRKVFAHEGFVTTYLGLGLLSGDGVGLGAVVVPSYRIVLEQNSGILYLAEGAAVRTMTPDGTVSTLFGPTSWDVASGLGLEETAGREAILYTPRYVCTGYDVQGKKRKKTLYFSDAGLPVIRAIVLDTGEVRVRPVAGTVLKGDGDSFRNPTGLTYVSYMDGRAVTSHLYVSDSGNNKIKEVSISDDGKVIRVSGNGKRGHHDGTAMDTQFNNPTGIAGSPGLSKFRNNEPFLVSADTNNHCIRIIFIGNIESWTIAGLGDHPTTEGGYQDGIGAHARFNFPFDVCLDPLPGKTGVFVADTRNHRIRYVELTSQLTTTVAGNGAVEWVDGPSPVASFSFPIGITSLHVGAGATNANACGGCVYVADQDSHTIRVVRPNATVSTISFCTTENDNVGKKSTSAHNLYPLDTFKFPTSVAFDPESSTELYVADSNHHRIVRLSHVAESNHISEGKLRRDNPYIVSTLSVGMTFGDTDFSPTTAICGDLFLATTSRRKLVQGNLSAPRFELQYTEDAVDSDGQTTLNPLLITEEPSRRREEVYKCTSFIVFTDTFAFYRYTPIARTSSPRSPWKLIYQEQNSGGGEEVTNMAAHPLEKFLLYSMKTDFSIRKLSFPSEEEEGVGTENTAKVETVIGKTNEETCIDGVGLEAAACKTSSICFHNDGTVAFTATFNFVLRRLELPTYRLVTVAGKENEKGSNDGVGKDARIGTVRGLTYLNKYSIVFADVDGNAIRRMDLPQNVVSTILKYLPGFRDTDTTSSMHLYPFPRFNAPTSLSLFENKLLVIDQNNNAIREVSLPQMQTTDEYGEAYNVSTFHVQLPVEDPDNPITPFTSMSFCGGGSTLLIAFKRIHRSRGFSVSNPLTFENASDFFDGIVYDIVPDPLASSSCNFVYAVLGWGILYVELGWPTTRTQIVAGSKDRTGYQDGTGIEASMQCASQLVIHPSSVYGVLFERAGCCLLRQFFLQNHSLRTIVGVGGKCTDSKDGFGTEALIPDPYGAAFQNETVLFGGGCNLLKGIGGIVYRVDFGNRYYTERVVGGTTLKGSELGDGVGLNAKLSCMRHIVFPEKNRDHLFYFFDTGSLRKVTLPDYVVVTVAGLHRMQKLDGYGISALISRIYGANLYDDSIVFLDGHFASRSLRRVTLKHQQQTVSTTLSFNITSSKSMGTASSSSSSAYTLSPSLTHSPSFSLPICPSFTPCNLLVYPGGAEVYPVRAYVWKTETFLPQEGQAPTPYYTCVLANVNHMYLEATNRKINVTLHFSTPLTNLNHPNFTSDFAHGDVVGAVERISIVNRSAVHLQLRIQDLSQFDEAVTNIQLKTSFMKCSVGNGTLLMTRKGDESTSALINVSLRFPAVPRPIPAAVQRSFKTVASVTSVVSANPVMVSLLSRSNAISSSLECFYSHTEPLEFIQSPLGLKLGAEKGQYYRGAIAGNFTLFVAFLIVIGCIASIVFVARRPTSTLSRVELIKECLATVRFPGIAVLPLAFLLEGTCSSITALAVHSDDNMDALLALIGALLVGALGVYMIAVTTVWRRCVLKDRPQEPDGTQLSIATSPLRKMLKFLLVEQKSWNGKENPQDLIWLQCFIFLFGDYRFSWFVAVDLCALIATGITNGIRINHTSSCRGQAVGLFILSTVYALLLVAARPALTRLNQFFILTLSVAGALNAAVLVIGAMTDSEGLLVLSDSIAFASALLGTGKFVLDLCLFALKLSSYGFKHVIREMQQRLTFSQRKENDDKNSSEDNTKKPGDDLQEELENLLLPRGSEATQNPTSSSSDSAHLTPVLTQDTLTEAIEDFMEPTATTENSAPTRTLVVPLPRQEVHAVEVQANKRKNLALESSHHPNEKEVSQQQKTLMFVGLPPPNRHSMKGRKTKVRKKNPLLLKHDELVEALEASENSDDSNLAGGNSADEEERITSMLPSGLLPAASASARQQQQEEKEPEKEGREAIHHDGDEADDDSFLDELLDKKGEATTKNHGPPQPPPPMPLEGEKNVLAPTDATAAIDLSEFGLE